AIGVAILDQKAVLAQHVDRLTRVVGDRRELTGVGETVEQRCDVTRDDQLSVRERVHQKHITALSLERHTKIEHGWSHSRSQAIREDRRLQWRSLVFQAVDEHRPGAVTKIATRVPWRRVTRRSWCDSGFP